MSLDAFAAAWRIDPGSPETDGHRAAKATRKLVLLCLADRANRDTGLAYPSVATISRDTGLGESTVRSALHALVATGLIVHDGWFGRGDRKVKRYRMGFHSVLVDNSNGLYDVANGLYDVAPRPLRRSTKPVIEPLIEPRPSKSERRECVRPSYPTPEETLAMLKAERA